MNPSHESDYIAGNPLFDDRNKLVVVSGCSGGGKSTLLTEMARRGYSVMPEPGRQIVKEELAIGGDGVPWQNVEKFIDLCVSRAMYFYNCAQLAAIGSARRHVLFDRSMLDNIRGFDDLGRAAPDRFVTALATYRYAHTVFVTPPWPELFASDDERRHSLANAVAEYEALLVSYRAHGYNLELIPRLPLLERADFLEAALTHC